MIKSNRMSDDFVSIIISDHDSRKSELDSESMSVVSDDAESIVSDDAEYDVSDDGESVVSSDKSSVIKSQEKVYTIKCCPRWKIKADLMTFLIAFSLAMIPAILSIVGSICTNTICIGLDKNQAYFMLLSCSICSGFIGIICVIPSLMKMLPN